MHLYELFESPFTPLGLSYIVNNPSAEPQAQPAINQNASIGTAPAPPTTVTSPQKTPQVVPGSAQPTINTAQSVSNPANATAVATANQQLTKGSPINLPLGPNKQPTAMKVTDISTNNALGNNQKMVTVGNPQKPNDPQQTYKFDDLANAVSNNGKG